MRDVLANERVARRVPEAHPAVAAARHQVRTATGRVRFARRQEGEARNGETKVVLKLLHRKVCTTNRPATLLLLHNFARCIGVILRATYCFVIISGANTRHRARFRLWPVGDERVTIESAIFGVVISVRSGSAV